MTVAELISLLQYYVHVNPGAEGQILVQARDAEGNSFSPVSEAELHCKYLAESTWSGDVIHPDDVDRYDDLQDVVCLWPVN